MKYKNRPDHQKEWFILHDLVSYNIHPEDVASDLIKKQFNLKINNPKISYLESFKGNDGTWHLPISYKVELDDTPQISSSENIEEMKWFDLNELPDRSEVAHHGWALDILSEIK